ncbi:terminase small subunit [Arthrobacter phage Basilisk]|nr:terminase small subunit [Arthrobacter phage Basilisk]
MDVWDTTNEAIQAARRAGVLTDMDEGACSALLQLAERLDDPDYPNVDGRFDNVTAALYFKACDQLGLTPAGRSRLAEKKEQKGGRLAELRAIQGGKTGKRTG